MYIIEDKDQPDFLVLQVLPLVAIACLSFIGMLMIAGFKK
jgi:hypothetical protein